MCLSKIALDGTDEHGDIEMAQTSGLLRAVNVQAHSCQPTRELPLDAAPTR